MSDIEKMSIATLRDGAGIQLIDEELNRVWENILDTNTDATKAREVVFKIKLVPDKTRETVDLILSVDSKLAPCKSEEARVTIGLDGGVAVATEWHSKQTELMDYVDSKVANIKNAQEG
jgi:hypothetical protein